MTDWASVFLLGHSSMSLVFGPSSFVVQKGGGLCHVKYIATNGNAVTVKLAWRLSPALVQRSKCALDVVPVSQLAQTKLES